MSRSLWLLALVVFAALSIVGVVAVTHPVRVEAPTNTAPIEPTAVARVSTDAGSLDSLLDAIQVEHLLKRGR